MDEDTQYPVGEGPAVPVSVSLPKGTVDAVRARAGKRGFASFVEEALLRQIQQDNLRELVAAHTAEFGEFTPEERAEARAALSGDDPAGHGAVA